MAGRTAAPSSSEVDLKLIERFRSYLGQTELPAAINTKLKGASLKIFACVVTTNLS
jgi:hypothetical protein